MTSKRTMNFIVNYNQLPAPETFAIEQALGSKKNQTIDQDEFE